MKRLYSSLVIIVSLTMITAFWIGCSESPTLPTAADGSEQEATVSEYFPLTEGSSICFKVINNSVGDTSYKNITISLATNIVGRTAYLWLQNDVNYSYIIDTGYIYVDGQALYYFEDENDIHEKLLESPLEVGSVWQRFDASQTQTGDNNLIDSLDSGSDTKDAGDGSLGDPGGKDGADNGGGTAKSFPTLGSNYFKISAIEDIELDNGNSFEGCLKVENGSGRSSNYYWYAPNIGLVRYVIGAGSASYPDGEIIGEIVSRIAN